MHQNILCRAGNTTLLNCGSCSLASLRPAHTRNSSNRSCPFGQKMCNCLKAQTIMCHKNICGCLYDEIIGEHATNSVFWRNTDANLWVTHPWAIARSFISVAGYSNVTCASDCDITGLLHLVINSLTFHQHISCLITGYDIFSQVRNMFVLLIDTCFLI